MSGPEERPSGESEAASPGPAEAEAKAPADSKVAEARPKETAKKTGPAELRDWRTLRPYLSLLDFGTTPKTKAGWVVRIAVTAIAFIVLSRHVGTMTRPLLSAKPPAAIPATEIEGYRFRMPEHTRRAIFTDLATAEIAERARAISQNTWKGHVWSREDDRGYQERNAARAAAAKYRVSLSQIYLVLDEGIRERWPGPDGNPLAATTPPLDIRSNSW